MSVASGLTGPLVVTYADFWLAWSAFTGNGSGESSVSFVAIPATVAPTVPATAQSRAYGVALGSTNLYWVSNDTGGNALVQSTPLSGGSVSKLGATTGTALVPLGMAINATSIYFVAYVSGGGGGLFQLPIAGGTPSEVWTAGPTGYPYDVAVDGSNVYWTDFGVGKTDGAVYSMPLGGGTVTTMASGIGGPRQLAVDSANVYFTAYNEGLVYEEAIGSMHPGVVASVVAPNGIAADDSDENVYFSSETQILFHSK
jgi:hypothetical protein